MPPHRTGGGIFDKRDFVSINPDDGFFDLQMNSALSGIKIRIQQKGDPSRRS